MCNPVNSDRRLYRVLSLIARSSGAIDACLRWGSFIQEISCKTPSASTRQAPAHGVFRLQEQHRLRTGFFVDNSAQDTRRLVIETNDNRNSRGCVTNPLGHADPLQAAQAAVRRPHPRHHALATYGSSCSMPTHILFEKRRKKNKK